jgi:hypothetical protein
MTPDDNKARLRRYILGALRDDEAAAIEEEYFVDADALEQVSAAEDELIEDYLEHRLDPESRARFDRHYLSTPGHRDRVSVVRGLMATAARANVSDIASASARTSARKSAASESTPRIAGWPTWQQIALAASIAVLVGVGTIWWLMTRGGGERQPQTPSIAASPTPAAPDAPAGSTTTPPAVAQGPAAPGSGSARPDAAAPTAPRPDAPRLDSPRPDSSGPDSPRAPVVVALSLSAISVRGAGADAPATIPAEATTLLLRLEAEGDVPPLRRGRAVVRTVEGLELWRGPAETARDATAGLRAIVRIPTARLRSGDLIVALHGVGTDGHESEQARYTLRITIADRRLR